MDRIIEYPLEQIVVDDFLNQRVADMIALGKLISALLGTQTAVEGLACTPTSPASMDVLVAPGQIFFLEVVDTTTYGDLSPTDNVFGHNVAANAATVMKQGLILSETTFALTAPSTSGDSVNYLISAEYQDQDTEDVVLNYFNSSNPSQPFQGPNNSGTAQPTLRQGKCVLTLTAGTAAATGTQQTPAVPSGNVGLYVITVAYEQTSITSSNISVYPGAPFLSQKLFGLMNGSGTVDVPALTASGLITANAGIDVAGGSITIPNATASNQPVALGQFPSLIAESGYKKIPDPNSPSGYIIEQWAYLEASASGFLTWTFPITFPNGAIFMLGMAITGFGTTPYLFQGEILSNSQATYAILQGNSFSNFYCYICVKGY